MKIFNWVHRRLRFAHHKDGLAGDAMTNGLGNADQTSHEDGAFADVFDGWRGGILTIGTFGYDPLEAGVEQNETPLKYDEEPEKEDNESDSRMSDSEEEDEPLMSAAYEHDYGGLLEVKIDTGNNVSEFQYATTKKERTTLAELFSADTEEMQQKKKQSNKGEIIKENESNMKQGFSFAKKLIGDQGARPIHKLNRLMRRMLKRKIHPEHGVNYIAKKYEIAVESASLLSTQVADTVM